MKLSWANRMTILRILLIVPFVSCMLKINDPELGLAMRYIATAVYLFMAISDALDGYLARTKKQVTKLGAFLDPVADKLLITSACLLLASERASVRTDYQSFLLIGKIATGLQLSMVAGILIAPEVSRFFPGWIWLLRVLWWSAAGTAILATLIYIRGGSRYIEQFEQSQANNAR